MRNPGCLCFRQHFPPIQPCQLRRCCLFLCIFLLLIVVIIGVPTLIVIFIIKPQKPIFSLQKVRLDTYKLDVYSNSSLFVSSVVSLTLYAANPNKIGMSYSPSRLQFYSEGLPVAKIRVPGFSQPAHSNNVTVKTRVLIDCVNVTQVLASCLQDQSGQNIVPMKLLGDVKVKLHFLHLTLPKIKVALDCDLNFVPGELAFIKEVLHNRAAKNPIAAFVNESKSYLKKCAFAIYV
ncbi:hypothetical protein SLA2020_199520 [Shorea laevis]